MSPPANNLGTLSEREILLLVYERVERIDRKQTDFEARIRVLEAERNQSAGRLAATSGGSGAIGGGVVAIVLKLMGWL